MSHSVDTVPARACLNCGARLHGRFCSQCGQRDVPPYPSVRELTHDAWHEFSGWDGRFIRTFRTLLRQPGALTLEVLDGHWARYVSPLRVYLTASVLYFLVAAAAPNLNAPKAAEVPGAGDVKIDLRDPRAAQQLTPEQRAALMQALDRAPWWARPILKSATADPVGLRQRFLTALPRVLFVLLPVFAAIVALFYRRRRFSQHLIFALHVHAVLFIVMAIGEASNFAGSPRFAAVVAIVGMVFLAWYGLAAFKKVYGGRWIQIVLKSAGVIVLYSIAGVAGIFAAITWAALA